MVAILNRFKGKEKALNVRIPADLHRRIDVYTAGHEMTIRQFVIQALEEKLAKVDGQAQVPPAAPKA